MSQLGFVILNEKEDKLERGQFTPEPRKSDLPIPIPNAPSKRPTALVSKVTPNDAAADFAIIYDGQKIMTHKSVLVAASLYFQRMFRFDGMEAQKNEVEIKDVDGQVMGCALSFMYTERYILPKGKIVPSTGYCQHNLAALPHIPPDTPRIFKRKCPCAGTDTSPLHLLTHIYVYALGDYLGMPKLKEFARNGVLDVLHVHWNDKDLKLAEALNEAFSSTLDRDLGIRKALVKTLRAHPGLWVDDGDVKTWLEAHPDVLEKVEYN